MAVIGEFPISLAVIYIMVLQFLWSGSEATGRLYFDKFGDCGRSEGGESFDLMHEDYYIRSVGGGLSHENTNCGLLFRAPPDAGVCITFKDFSIDDCGVKLEVTEGQTISKIHEWREFGCQDTSPKQMCTGVQYVSLRVRKKTRNYNRGYNFEIVVERSTSVTGGGVLAASIGVLIGSIVGVVVFVIILAVLVIYCCRRRHHRSEEEVNMSDKGRSDLAEKRTEPSAPPGPPEMSDPLMHPGAGAVANYNDPPPPYSEHPFLTEDRQPSQL